MIILKKKIIFLFHNFFKKSIWTGYCIHSTYIEKLEAKSLFEDTVYISVQIYLRLSFCVIIPSVFVFI